MKGLSRVLIVAMLLLPAVGLAQRLEPYTDHHGHVYLAMYAYGLPRSVVKTNAEMAASVVDGYGMMRRHHVTKGVDESIDGTTSIDGYDGNRKVSFAFVVAPSNVDVSGEVNNATISWAEASGWSTTITTETSGINASNDNDYGVGTGVGESIIADTPTGCAAYGGIEGDEVGEWRLPTQRELQMMFTVSGQAINLANAGYVTDVAIPDGTYWSATEHYPVALANWYNYTVNSATGEISAVNRSAYNAFYYARCVKDLYYTINGAIPTGKETAAE